MVEECQSWLILLGEKFPIDIMVIWLKQCDIILRMNCLTSISYDLLFISDFDPSTTWGGGSCLFGIRERGVPKDEFRILSRANRK